MHYPSYLNSIQTTIHIQKNILKTPIPLSQLRLPSITLPTHLKKPQQIIHCPVQNPITYFHTPHIYHKPINQSILPKPLLNIPTIPQHIPLLTPQHFPTPLHLLLSNQPHTSQPSIHPLNQKFSQTFQNKSFSQTLFPIPYI
ncbi:accessory Sec system protein Asp2, partial [Staphylococcus aureus]|uniref:accessory Sec system protein Asp2 n=1 Tax=Staphylococcus aureus TaxID=1280 RepID=UPI0037DA1E71